VSGALATATDESLVVLHEQRFAIAIETFALVVAHEQQQRRAWDMSLVRRFLEQRAQASLFTGERFLDDFETRYSSWIRAEQCSSGAAPTS
jgi:hypothetical protein